jgi:hypothetical protein
LKADSDQHHRGFLNRFRHRILRENGPVFEFPLCLSRACLGKMMRF